MSEDKSNETFGDSAIGNDTVDDTIIFVSSNFLYVLCLSQEHIKYTASTGRITNRQMEIYMTENKLKEYILGTTQRTEANSRIWDEKDAEAQAFIMRGIELEQLKYLTECTTAAQMWSKLKIVHSEKCEQSAQVLLEKFINCKMDLDESIVNYVARVVSLAQRLKDMDMEQKQPMVIAKILSSLPSKYDHVRTAWYAVPRAEQNIERLTDHLVNEESLMNLRSAHHVEDDTVKTAYSVNKFNKKPKMRTKRSGSCNYCHKEGHWARECFKKQRDSQNSISNEKHSLALERETGLKSSGSNSSKQKNAENTHLFVLQTNTTQNKMKNIFYADSGATDHMTFLRELLKNFREFSTNACQVKVGDGRRLDVCGIGDIEVYAMNQEKFIHTIKDVYWCMNLI
ncbi:uncharacterized protein LOC118753396 [Rhagoletis pomonella]|uniref:uncharacterized protein LOC118753385 n=1 Tax=Rhagoletis pomonella TaxID=28610 RepID=UPI00178610D7|nr:uncharacterized protein LOC118753385 [Rhagoletis pomonella]XP_036344162.1 uncharacterized protein LOC118753396 [Rhagoletis pomonella]